MALESKTTTSAQLATLFLWLLTCVLSVACMLAGRELLLRNYLRFVSNPDNLAQQGYTLLNILIMLPLTILVIGIIIGGAEYHRVRVGTPASWRLFSRTLAVEVAILLIAFFI